MTPIAPPTSYPTGYTLDPLDAEMLSMLIEQTHQRRRIPGNAPLFRFHVLGELAGLEGMAWIAGYDWGEAVGKALDIVDEIQQHADHSHAFKVLEDGLLDWLAAIHKASHANLCQMLRIITNRFAAATEKTP